jgi:hypothetical protein
MRKIWFFFLILFLSASCEPDDVCGEANPSTPQLIFRFHSSSQPNEFKAVDNLQIFGLGEEVPLEFINADSIALPLQVSANKINLDFTLSDRGTERLEIDYQTEDVYLSRACGFQSTFIINEIEIINNNSWINSIEVVTNKVVTDTLAHVKIYH